MRAVLALKSAREIECMRASGEIVAEVLDAMSELVRPDVTTGELDSVAEGIIRDHAGAQPAFKGYGGFPASICASVNDEVVHGIPSKSRALKEGDIVGIDVGVVLDGFHADAARTFQVGQVADGTARLLEVTREALGAGIEAARVATIARSIEGKVYGGVEQAIEAASHGIFLNRDLAMPASRKRA